MRRALIEALRAVAPDRQSPQDLEAWQDTLLPRAGEFVAAWRVLSEEERGGFLVLDAAFEIWRDQLARAARAPGGAARALPARLLVLADAFPLLDRAADEELDAGREAAAALEAELARRGAVIVATTDRSPWAETGAATDESHAALATAAGRRLEADAVVVCRLSRAPGGLVLAVEAVAVSSESALGSARATLDLGGNVAFGEALAPAVRQIAAALAPRLAAARSGHGRPLSP